MSAASIELEMIHEAVEHITCPRCDAPAGARCANPITGREARIPCLARIQAVDAY